MTKPATKKRLGGIMVGISVANSPDLDKYGYSADDVNRVIVQLCESLVHDGARLAFGHDWRPDGVMDAINRAIVSAQEPGSPDSPWVENFLPWPTQPTASEEVRFDLQQRGLVRITETGLPDNYRPGLEPTDKDRAVALCWLREKITECSAARVCIGGKIESAQGFHAGVLEEAWRAAKAERPVYVARFLGGASAVLANELLGKGDAKQKALAMTVLEKRRPDFNDVKDIIPDLLPAEDLSAVLLEKDLLRKQSGLDEDDWRLLLTASDVNVFTALVLRGLRKLMDEGKLSAPKDGQTTADDE